MDKNELKTPYYDFYILEKEMNLFSLKYKGVSYWQLIRFGLLRKITTKDLDVAHINSKSRNIGREIVGAFKEAMIMNKMVRKLYQVDIIRIRPCVTLDNEGNLDDHQYDYANLNKNFIVLDLYALGSYENTNRCVMYSMAPAEKKVIMGKIKNKLLKTNSIEKWQRELLAFFLEKINNIYGTEFSLDELLRDIRYSVMSHIAYKKYYIKLFKKLKVKCIMEYPHYDEHMFAATAAAKELQITSVEMQHASVKGNEAYWYEDMNQLGKILPDYFFTYGEWWNEQIKLPAFFKTCAVGNPYMDMQVKRNPPQKSDKFVISVFSSPHNGKTLSEFIYAIQDYCIENNIEILYKLHPNEREIWREEYPLLLKMKKAKIIDSGSVYEVLSKSNATIGVNSSVFFEALVYKELDIYIYTVGHYEGMKVLIENGMVMAVNDVNDFVEKLKKSGDYHKKGMSREKMWKENPIPNINMMIELIIDK